MQVSVKLSVLCIFIGWLVVEQNRRLNLLTIHFYQLLFTFPYPLSAIKYTLSHYQKSTLIYQALNTPQVVPYTECALGMEPQPFTSSLLAPKLFVEKICSQGKKVRGVLHQDEDHRLNI